MGRSTKKVENHCCSPK